MNFTDVKNSYNSSAKVKDFEYENYKFGASFSFQWGQQLVQNGFEFGFEFDWSSILKIEDEKLGDDGHGFGLYLGYKISLFPGYRSR